MKELVIATANEGKVREFREMLKRHGITVLSLREFPGHPEIIEDGKTFEENALKKARILASYTRDVVIADDSGLEVDSLNGAPGVRSARYAGEGASDHDNNKKLLDSLRDVPREERKAAFRCAIAVVSPDGRETVVDGRCSGTIGFEPRGKEGFGYDPVFIPEGYDKTFAELGIEIKNRISHRAKAVSAMNEIIGSFLNTI